MAQLVFARTEKKYIISADIFDAVRERVREHMIPDGKYPIYTLCNIYYDSPSFELARRSVEKPTFKEKLRIRSYGTPAPDGKVYVETKTKYKGIVYKRRASMPYDKAISFISDHTPQKDSQIIRELDYFSRRFELEPKVYLAYDREAYSHPEQQDLRLTFDTGIRYRTYDLSLSAGDYGEQLITDGSVIMEVKADHAIPQWLLDIFKEYSILPGSFSKYGTIYKKLITDGEVSWISY